MVRGPAAPENVEELRKRREVLIPYSRSRLARRLLCSQSHQQGLHCQDWYARELLGLEAVIRSRVVTGNCMAQAS